MHLPVFLREVWNADEAFVAVQARALDGGAGGFYEIVADRKPPLLPALYLLVHQLAGNATVWVMHGLALAAHLATALLLAAAARGRWGGRAGLVAGLLYVVGSAGLSPEDAQAANFEVFALPAVAAAVLLADRRRFAAAGGAAAVAALTLQAAGGVLLPVLWLAWRAAGRRGVLSAGGVFLAVVGAAAARVGWADFWFWVVFGNGGYTNVSGAWDRVALRGLGGLGIFLLANLGAVLLAGADRARRGRGDLWLWLVVAVAGVCTSLHFFGHYFLLLLPPVVLLAARAAATRPRLPLAPLGYGLTAAAVFVALALVWPAGKDRHAELVAERVRARTEPGAAILVWGMDPRIYWWSRRPAATRFLSAGFMTNFGGGRDASRVGERFAPEGVWRDFEADLRRRPPALVVDDSRGAPYAPDRIGRFHRYLLAGYRPVEVVDGSVLYARQPAAAGAAARLR
ncbi:glycosyltransferase [Actinomadura craniellae]|uniref:Glycosyltransferase n=1 Tax=Actinomadura craniellae TaxID=2231787 RepID=A0A365H2A0_9ACTN|nr:glycosyltransferase [Actinomadura craniellae]RAY13158.1 glycosyltransferase [Actinomadura craniellae]